MTVAFASAQQSPHAPQPTPDHDPLAQFMFPPELVMQHQREIGLTDEQKTFLRGEIQRVTLRFTELQWQLQDEMEGLASVMKESSVNEQQVLSQLDKKSRYRTRDQASAYWTGHPDQERANPCTTVKTSGNETNGATSSRTDALAAVSAKS